VVRKIVQDHGGEVSVDAPDAKNSFSGRSAWRVAETFRTQRKPRTVQSLTREAGGHGERTRFDVRMCRSTSLSLYFVLNRVSHRRKV